MAEKVTKTVKTVSYKDLSYENKVISATKVRTIWELEYLNTPGKNPKLVNKKAVSIENTEVEFPLREISIEELKELRKEKVPSFVLKVEGKFFHTKIPKTLNFVAGNILGNHMCSYGVHTCNRLSAASDSMGGCQKVRDLIKRIENYPWMAMACETFGTNQDSFMVLECSHFSLCPSRVERSFRDVNRLKISLAEYFYGTEFSSKEQVKRHVTDRNAFSCAK